MMSHRPQTLDRSQQAAAPRRAAPLAVAATALVAAAAVVGLFLGYLAIARSVGTNADGASNTLQAWDMLHGNLLLHGWTTTDVSFYGTELVEQAFLESIIGLRPDVLPVGAALTYTLIVVLVALLAKGRVTGVPAAARVALAVAIVLVPAPGLGVGTLLSDPDHTGTAVPVLLTWLVLDRATTDRAGRPCEPGRALPFVIAALLAWGIIADPLVILLGAVPLAVVGMARLGVAGRWRPGSWRGLDARLVVAASASVLAARGVQWLIRLAGGFATQPMNGSLAAPDQLGRHLTIAGESIAVLFGGYFPTLHGPFERTVGGLHLLGVALAAGAVVLTVARALCGRAERSAELLAAGIVVNLVAFVVSALSFDVRSAREVAPVLPLAAVLTARVWIRDHRERVRPRARAARAFAGAGCIAVAALLAVAFVRQAVQPAQPPAGQRVAQWLSTRQLNYGIGGYWTASTITLDTGGAIRVAPVTAGSRIMAYRSEARTDWYDPRRHDARFVVIDLHAPGFGTVAEAVTQFGPPVERAALPSGPGRSAVVLVYDRNLLAQLPAWCSRTQTAASMAACD